MRILATAMVLATAPLAALSLVSAPAAAQVATPIIADGTILDVSAEGRSTRVPDVATIRAGVVTQAATAAEALADNATRMAAVLDALKRAGVAPRDTRTANVSLSPQYRYADNQPPAVTGYQANNSVAIRFRDIAKAGRDPRCAGQAGRQPDRRAEPVDRPARRSARRSACRRREEGASPGPALREGGGPDCFAHRIDRGERPE